MASKMYWRWGAWGMRGFKLLTKKRIVMTDLLWVHFVLVDDLDCLDRVGDLCPELVHHNVQLLQRKLRQLNL